MQDNNNESDQNPPSGGYPQPLPGYYPYMRSPDLEFYLWRQRLLGRLLSIGSLAFIGIVLLAWLTV